MKLQQSECPVLPWPWTTETATRPPANPASPAGNGLEPCADPGGGRFHRRILVPWILLAAGLAVTAQAEKVRVTVIGHYEYVGAAPSPTADFSLSFTLERQPPVCGGGEGSYIACGASLPVYENGPLRVVLSTPTVLFRDAAHKGGLQLYQSDAVLNRLGFSIGASQLWTGTLAEPTLVDGLYDLCPAHEGQVHPEMMTELCSYAGQGFAVGDVIDNPFHDPVTLQSDNPILSGTVRIEPDPDSLPGPGLTIAIAGTQATLQWLETSGFSLERTLDVAGGTWTAVTEPPLLANGTNTLTLPMEMAGGFFRLRKP